MLRDLPDMLPAVAEREAADPERYPERSVAALYEAGVPQAPLPASLGGEGASCRHATEAIETIATVSPSLALIAAMPLGLAGCMSLEGDGAASDWHVAWRRDIERIAADYRAGKLYAACNSEKGAGGSLAATKTIAIRDSSGTFALSGEKILATSGSYASTFISTAKVDAEELPGAGIVEFFLVDAHAPGVEILSDWNGFGMRSTESHSVRYEGARASGMVGFPNYIEAVQPVQYWYCLFAAIPLGCAKSILNALGTPTPTSPALRLRLAEAQMRYEAMRAYLLETSGDFRASAGPAYAARVLRAKTYVTQEATKLSAELFALSGGRHYSRSSGVARAFADAFAGTALRPPLALGLDTLVEQFNLGVG
jgi:alkylation response protein AidB-like acyl-CoA dehydrogenase